MSPSVTSVTGGQPPHITGILQHIAIFLPAGIKKRAPDRENGETGRNGAIDSTISIAAHGICLSIVNVLPTSVVNSDVDTVASQSREELIAPSDPCR